MTQIQLNDAAAIVDMLRRLDEPHSANVVKALIDEVAQLKAREAELEAKNKRLAIDASWANWD